ncbi:hypothetical protein Zmor_003063 [Zophobas morio]|uniref:Uncharacterized protein n=1 Tax=Zophobas morio TaxID=2755281 RepID=A0AA38HNH3_9CUCU|nr:hypothetical protein Zmor_003063 [Zophobas morio]
MLLQRFVAEAPQNSHKKSLSFPYRQRRQQPFIHPHPGILKLFPVPVVRNYHDCPFNCAPNHEFYLIVSVYFYLFLFDGSPGIHNFQRTAYELVLIFSCCER